MRRQKHTDFYYKLHDMTSKVYLYTSSFAHRVPFYEKSFREKQRMQKLDELRRWKKQQNKGRKQ